MYIREVSEIKRSVTISIILICIIMLSIIGVMYIKNTSDRLIEQLEQTTQYIKEKDFEAAKKKALQIQKNWKRSGGIIDTYVNHHEIDLIEEELNELISYLKREEVTMSLGVIESIKFKLHHIYQMELPLLKNIF